MARETQPLYTAKLKQGVFSPVAVGPTTTGVVSVESSGFGYRALARGNSRYGGSADRAVVNLNKSLVERGQGFLAGDSVLPGYRPETRAEIDDSDQVRLVAVRRENPKLGMESEFVAELRRSGEVVDTTDVAGDRYRDLLETATKVVVVYDADSKVRHYSFGDAGTAAEERRKQGNA